MGQCCKTGCRGHTELTLGGGAITGSVCGMIGVNWGPLFVNHALVLVSCVYGAEGPCVVLPP